MGEYYYKQKIFQSTLEKLEKTKPGKFQLIQKDDIVRFVIQDIPDYDAALKFLQRLLA